MLRRTPLARSKKPLARAPMKQKAPKKAGPAPDLGPAFCLACGTGYQLTRSHILTQKQYPNFRHLALNQVYLCTSCHPIWEHNKAAFKQQYPVAFAEKVRRMGLLDRQALAFFKMKNEALFPPRPGSFL